MKKTTEIILDPDFVPLKKRLQDVLNAYKKVAEGIDDAFRQADMTDAISDTVRLQRYTQKLDGQLSYLRMNLGSLKSALTEAFAPIGAYILPVINRCISKISSFLHTLAAVLAVVTDTVTGTDSLGQSNEKTAKSYKSLGSAAKKTLASFDQIQRLNDASGSAAAEEVTYDPQTPVTENMKALADKLLQLLQPLMNIDLAPLQTALQNLWQTVQPLLSQLGDGLLWLYQSVAAPFIAWCLETLVPALTDHFSGALGTVSSATSPLITGLKLLWDAMQPVASFVKESIVVCLQSFKGIFGELSTQLQEKGPAICTIFNGIRDVIQKVWTAIAPVLTSLRDSFANTFGQIGRVVTQVLGAILEGLAGVTEFVAGVFTGDWKRAWNGVLLFLKSIVNSLIGMLNAMLQKLTGTLNAVVGLLGSLKFTVPKWVPGIGGESFQFPSRTFQAPQIPYLAKGAVLPANKPFMAVVGDQRHGTNIEAPLATIQEAVVNVMQEYVSANMAGHNATVDVLRQILEAVLGIEVGDEVIASAVTRHQTKMAIARGGYV